MKRVLIYTHEFPPFAGGAGVYSYDLAAGLADLGVEVHVATPKQVDHDSHHAWPNLSRLILHYMAPWQTEVPWVHYYLLRLFWKYRFDIVLITERVAQARMALLQRPWFGYVTVIHGSEVLWYFGDQSHSWDVDPQRVASLYHQAEMCIAVTHATAQLTRRLVRSERLRVETVVNGISLDRLGLPDPEQVGMLRRHYGEDSEIILCLARLDLDKGHDVLLRAFSHVLSVRPRARLLIGGVGPYHARLVKACEALHVSSRVEFLGKIAQESLPHYYSLCDVFAMPSRCEVRWEGFGLVYLEANFYGKPVVGGNEGGVPEAIADGQSGFAVNPRDPQAVSDAIVRLLADKEYGKIMGDTGYRRLHAHFTARRMAEETLALLEDILKQRRWRTKLIRTVRIITWSAHYLWTACKHKRLRRLGVHNA